MALQYLLGRHHQVERIISAYSHINYCQVVDEENFKSLRKIMYISTLKLGLHSYKCMHHRHEGINFFKIIKTALKLRLSETPFPPSTLLMLQTIFSFSNWSLLVLLMWKQVSFHRQHRKLLPVAKTAKDFNPAFLMQMHEGLNTALRPWKKVSF